MTRQQWLEMARASVRNGDIHCTPTVESKEIEPHDPVAAELWNRVESHCQGAEAAFSAFRAYLKTRLEE